MEQSKHETFQQSHRRVSDWVKQGSCRCQLFRRWRRELTSKGYGKNLSQTTTRCHGQQLRIRVDVDRVDIADD